MTPTWTTHPPQPTLSHDEPVVRTAIGARLRDAKTPALVALAAVFLIAALLDPDLGKIALIPFGLLLAFSASGETGGVRTVLRTARNLALAGALAASLAVLWLGHADLSGSGLVAIAAVAIALPLALQESAPDSTGGRTVVVTTRSSILSITGLVTLVFLYQDRGVWFIALGAVCLVLPLVLAASRTWMARRGRVELGLLRHPLHRQVRGHLVQGLNIWLSCLLLAGVVAAGGIHHSRIVFALDDGQFGKVSTAVVAGLALLAALALVPPRRIHVPTNLLVAVFSVFLAVQLGSASTPASGVVILDPPVAGEWFVQNGGRSVLLNGHSPNESNAVDLQLMGADGRTHTGGSNAPLSDYAGFGQPVLAPADGRIIGVADDYPDNPPGTNSDRANHVVIALGGDRYVVLAHIEHGSATVEVGDLVRQGQQLAAVGNNGHSSAPHLHLQVQDTPSADVDASRTYPLHFRNAEITRGGAWPWGDSHELRTGDFVRASRP